MLRTALALPSRASRLHPQMLMQMTERRPDRLARLEVLCDLQQQLTVQIQHIADLQVQLDRSIADRPIPRSH
jgi:hypothetical protein